MELVLQKLEAIPFYSVTDANAECTGGLGSQGILWNRCQSDRLAATNAALTFDGVSDCVNMISINAWDSANY